MDSSTSVSGVNGSVARERLL
ncbi:hypothetical protein CCACVL1_14959 [Corchorus capsularis]|uniref:Uncharacterized protein n=1 Tax=Corchorus capsularis TaxID=210143 RepID=A0A1R3I4S8_COCAP|nr:hypothetical protein CCACVL1_14959 [Corchorus capsularis]